MSITAVIPLVDFSSLSLNQTDDELDETKMKETISEMMNAFSTTGFVYLSNTHFPDHLVRLSTHLLLAFSYNRSNRICIILSVDSFAVAI